MLKLRSQNLLVMMPIFIGMTCLISLSRYTIEMQEVRWGLTQEVTGYASAMSAFLGAQYDQSAAQEQRQTAFKAVMERIATTAKHRVHYVVLYHVDGVQPLFSWGAVRDATPIPHDALSSVLQHETVVREREPAVGAPQLLIADAPTYPPSSSHVHSASLLSEGEAPLFGILSVAIGASDLREQSAHLLREMLWHAIIILAIGVAATLVMSALVTQPIVALSKRVGAERADVEDTEQSLIIVQEFSDLSNTFDTLQSVLEESETRINQALISGMQFRSRPELAKTYVDQFWQPLSQRYGTIDIAASLVGERALGSFFGVIPRPNDLYLLVGRIQCQGDLDPVVTASAACSFIKEELQHLDLATVYARASELFHFDVFECLQYVEGQPWCTIQRMPAQAPRTLEPFLQRIHADQAIIMHTFTGDIADQIAIYARRFSHLPAAALMNDLIIFIDPDADGALACLKPQRAVDSPPHA